MNIIIDGHSLHVLGGMERTITDLASHLAERGHTVFYFLTEEPPTPPLYNVHPSVNIVIYTHNGRRKHLRKFREQILACKADICISPASDRRHFPWCVALENTGIPFIVSEHSSPQYIEREMLAKSERRAILEAADGIRLLLPSYGTDLPQKLQAKIRGIHNAVNLPQVLPIAHSHPTIISMGRLSAEKQNNILIDAFALLHKEFPTWKIEIWGTGPEKSRLQLQVDTLHLSQHIFFKGLTKTPEQSFAGADIVCLPSRYEGFPGAVAQGMTAGLPVVGFAKCPGTNEMIQHGTTGLLAQNMNASSLAEALRPLMQDAVLRKKMGKAGKMAAQDYTPQKVFDMWEFFLQEIALKKGNTALQNKTTQALIHKELSRGLAKRINVLVPEGDMGRALVFQFPWLKRKIHPLYTWFKCRFLQ